MFNRRRAVLGVTLIIALVAIPAIVKIKADRRLRLALRQIDSALTRADLEKLIGSPPDLVLPSSSDHPAGLDELFWSRAILKSQNVAELEGPRFSRGEWCEKIPGATLQGVYLHAYVKRNGQVFSVEAIPPCDSFDYFKDQLKDIVGRFRGSAIPSLPPAVAIAIPVASPEEQSAVLQSGSNQGTPPEEDTEQVKRLGDLIISGNVRTSDDVIRKILNFYPGQTITLDDVKSARRKLANAGIFKVEPKQGIRPTVQWLDPDFDRLYHDMLITVTER
jgi:hypothetical protein